jgi:DNA repair protein RadA/Sms
MCPNCKQWNVDSASFNPKNDGTILLKDVVSSNTRRIRSGPWDPNFGEGGIAIKSANLIAGVPGAGKSTLVSQIMSSLAVTTNKEVLLVSAEEEEEQAKERTERLRLKGYEKIRILPVQKRRDVSLEEIIGYYKPCCFALDSVSMFTPDLEEQVEIAKQAKLLAVKLECIAFVIAHVTKEGKEP